MPEENTTVLSAQAAMMKFLDLMVQEDIPHWMELWHEEAVFEYPFAPDGFPQQVSGKQAIFDNFKDFPNTIKFFEFTDVQMHPTLNPDTLIIEFACRGRAVTTGKPYNQRYISVVQMADGKIARYRDYWNPLVILEAFDGGDAFKSASHGDGVQNQEQAE